MKVLVVGGGGREHAIAWAFSRCADVELIAAPGNPGIGSVAELHDLSVDDTDGLIRLARSASVDLAVVGPEAPLVAGLADGLREAGVACLGPGLGASALEGSKWFAKQVMTEAGVASADALVFDDPGEAISHMGDDVGSWVIKADGLAAGKGVFLPDSREEALSVLSGLSSGRLGDSGRRFLIERRLSGREVSVLAVCGGGNAAVLPASRDHKRVGEGDTGPNTGGMGAVCPPQELDSDFAQRVRGEVILPVLQALSARGMDYRGVLYAGLMVSEESGAETIRVLEFNVRFGDPETQAQLPLTDPDGFLESCLLASRGQDPGRESIPLRDDEESRAAACVVLASGGYPGSYEKGVRISGLDTLKGDALVFQAGTAVDTDGQLVTSGGRVLGVTATGRDLDTALQKAYIAVDRISFEDMYFRRDIGRTS